MKEKVPLQLDGITIFSKNTKDETKLTETSNKDGEATPVFADAYIFQDMRMEVRNNRSKTIEQLTSKVTSSDYSAEEKLEAYDEIEKLSKQEHAEALMEMQIKALGYLDAFVRSDNGKVSVTVLSTEGHSKKMADEISHYVLTSWEDAREVQVDFRGDKQ